MTHRATAWLSRGQLNLTCDQTSKSGHSLEPGCRVERHLPRARVRRRCALLRAGIAWMQVQTRSSRFLCCCSPMEPSRGRAGVGFTRPMA